MVLDVNELTFIKSKTKIDAFVQLGRLVHDSKPNEVSSERSAFMTKAGGNDLAKYRCRHTLA